MSEICFELHTEVDTHRRHYLQETCFKFHPIVDLNRQGGGHCRKCVHAGVGRICWAGPGE